MLESGNRDDDPAADRGKLTRELEDLKACKEGMSAGTSADINKDIAQLSNQQEVVDACNSQRWSNVQSDCPLGIDIKMGTVNGILDGRAITDDTTEEAEGPPGEPNQIVVKEVTNGRKRRACVDAVNARAYNKGDDNNSKDVLETRRKIKKPTNLGELTEESRNSKDTNPNLNSKNKINTKKLSKNQYPGLRSRNPLKPNVSRVKKQEEQGNPNSENSKIRKRSPGNDDNDSGSCILTEIFCTEKLTRRTKTKITNAKKQTTASSSKAKSVKLVSTDESKDNLAEAKLTYSDEQRLKDEEDNRTKMERVKQRLQEEVPKAKLEERNEKLKFSVEQTGRDQMERIELNSEGPGQGSGDPSVEVVPTNHSGMKQTNVEVVSDNRDCKLSQREQFPCPICNKNFPAEEIEVHAARCEEYNPPSSAGGSRLNPPVLPMSLGTPKQRDMFSNSPGKEGLQDHEVEKPTRKKKAKIANAKKPTTACSSRTTIVELVSTDESEDDLGKSELIHQEERRIRDEATTRRKVERVKQRVQEEAKKAKLEERNEKLRLAFEQSWREKMRAIQKVPSAEQGDVEDLSDDRRGNLSQPEQVLCPICSKNFSIGEIEIHAAHCEEYDPGSSADGSRSNSPVVSMSLGMPTQRDMLPNMPGEARLRDDEVAEQLENDKEEIVQSSLVDSSRIGSSRPSSHVRMQCKRLAAEQQKKDKATSVNVEEQRVKEKEETRRKVERVKHREEWMGLAHERVSGKCKQRRLVIEQTRSEEVRAKKIQRKTERIETNPEGPRQGNDGPSIEVVPENHSGMKQRDVEERSDNRRRNLSQPKRFPCPICSINFPVGKIEAHAARCGEYNPPSSAGGSTSNSPVVPMSLGTPKQRNMFSTLLECYMCSKFTTRNAWEFESHVTSCLARQRASRETVCCDTGSREQSS